MAANSSYCYVNKEYCRHSYEMFTLHFYTPTQTQCGSIIQKM